MNHVKCRHCWFHVRAGDSADDVAAGHQEATDHVVDVVPDSALEYRRASELTGDPAVNA